MIFLANSVLVLHVFFLYFKSFNNIRKIIKKWSRGYLNSTIILNHKLCIFSPNFVKMQNEIYKYVEKFIQKEIKNKNFREQNFNAKVFEIFWCELKLTFNPCEHRATSVAQANLKSSKKGKKRDRRIFSFKHIIKNLNSVPKK